MRADPHAPITRIKGVGPKLAETLQRLGIFRVLDLLLHLPYRYQDRTRITPMTAIRAGEPALVSGEVVACSVQFGKRRSLKVTLRDQTGQVHLRFFHFSRYQHNALEAARYIRAYGEFRFFGRELTAAHPEYETFDIEPAPPTPELTPIYPTTQGLGQARIRRILDAVCGLDWPQDAGTPYADLIYLHQPPAQASESEIEAVQTRLAADELCAFYLVMKGRALQRKQDQATPLPQAQGLGRQLLAHLNFKLTKAQARVVAEVLNDLAGTVPMLRLVQGDVGSGKTVIAAFAAIRAAEHGGQAALMAPTELLAEQHHVNFSAWLEPLGLRTVLLTGRMTAAQQRNVLTDIASGEAQIIIGTHALFQEKVDFHKLVLSIIDEQHRFGVHQRMSLRDKGLPHQLVMTATPIPRTLTMALYADMDVSVIDELPKGRQPITTHTVEESRRDELIEQIRSILRQGQQAYWVCTLIEDSDEIDATSAQSAYQLLSEALPEFRVALLHGRMKGDEKVGTMQRFQQGEVDLLVATTVIEVGVDVANATHMVIENAERLGLAQLHQLRGRVGRGQTASRCYLLFESGLSEAARTRLTAMRDSQDGFYLAEQDLKLRGPGDILGTRQSGEQTFRIADLTAHAHLIPDVAKRGDAMLAAPANSPEHAQMIEILKTWAPADSGNLTV